MKCLVLVLALAACGGQTREIARAKQARYDAELPVLLAETAAVLRQYYENVEVDPRGTIVTAWTLYPPVRSQRGDDLFNTRTNYQRNATHTLYLARFHITISSERPSRIEVTAHAAKLPRDAAMPTELARKDEPYWTRDLEERVHVKIHERLQQYAR